ncbi:arsenite methyltransferase [Brienomyrus brachyistius]|uniref:arsenite methyltransferase n=1 Tax=Brienomyrus brachyistius TaxID=42636 RepID=UPI0020B1CA5F|nr:arsenite methyltransferase [Brienomyrus brachyistius]XP_048837349.1 arsenite methyltransferase [Brienomyrus brachyistius]XP_048837350.1 arsenite methyltransferase [Brienomyrus brachyistius]
MTSSVHENVQKYYGARLETSRDLQTNAACALPSRCLPRGAVEALKLVHPEVCKKYFGCGPVIPEKLQGCKVLDLGSGSGRDCYILSKLVGKDGLVIGIDMTEELIAVSQKYVQYHQEQFGYDQPNTVFVQGYMEKLREAGIQSDALDVLVSNCVICLCPDKKAIFTEAHRVLKEGGEFYFSDMYSSEVVPEHLKQDPVLWGEGMGGSLYWRDFISLAQEIGFSTPYLVSASHIIIHDSELLRKAGDISYASGTYRLFKLPKTLTNQYAVVTYKGTVLDHPDELEFDVLHTFKTGVPVHVDAEMAEVLQQSRFSQDFCFQSSDLPATVTDSTNQTTARLPFQHCQLSPFLLADRLGSAVTQCSKTRCEAGCEVGAGGVRDVTGVTCSNGE